MDIREENTTDPNGRAPLHTQFSRAFCAVSNSLVFPHPSHVSFSCSAPCVRQTKQRFSYGFRLGSILEPQDCRAELSGARLKSRLPIPPAAHISETDKILPLGTLRKKIILIPHAPLRSQTVSARSYQMPGKYPPVHKDGQI